MQCELKKASDNFVGLCYFVPNCSKRIETIFFFFTGTWSGGSQQAAQIQFKKGTKSINQKKKKLLWYLCGMCF